MGWAPDFSRGPTPRGKQAQKRCTYTRTRLASSVAVFVMTALNVITAVDTFFLTQASVQAEHAVGGILVGSTISAKHPNSVAKHTHPRREDSEIFGTSNSTPEAFAIRFDLDWARGSSTSSLMARNVKEKNRGAAALYGGATTVGKLKVEVFNADTFRRGSQRDNNEEQNLLCTVRPRGDSSTLDRATQAVQQADGAEGSRGCSWTTQEEEVRCRLTAGKAQVPLATGRAPHMNTNTLPELRWLPEYNSLEAPLRSFLLNQHHSLGRLNVSTVVTLVLVQVVQASCSFLHPRVEDEDRDWEFPLYSPIMLPLEQRMSHLLRV